jgi:hypothetical protein
MVAAPSDPERPRRQRRTRMLIGLLGALVAIGVVVLLAAGGGDGSDHERELVQVPYGETMSASEYAVIDEGESEAQVLDRLDKTGRPEAATKSYVLVLFPNPKAEDACTYWEFSDEPQIFAQLCFDRDSGELVSKRDANVHQGLEEQEGQITA